MAERVAKCTGGLVRASAAVEQGRLRGVHLSGDFFFRPADLLEQLEKALENEEAGKEALGGRIRQFFQARQAQMPGIQPEELAGLLASLASPG